MFGLFKKKPPTAYDTLSSRTTREQRKEWLTSAPKWDQLAPPVIEAILDAITDKGLFEAFVLESMAHDLISKYEMVGREETDKTLIRARISRILCQLGNQARVSLAEALKAKAGREAAVSNATLAEIAFESAIAMAKDQIVAYEGLSAIYGMAGDRAKCHDYAKLGLAELADAAWRVRWWPALTADLRSGPRASNSMSLLGVKQTFFRLTPISSSPRVVLRATNEAALAHCSLGDLKRFAMDLA